MKGNPLYCTIPTAERLTSQDFDICNHCFYFRTIFLSISYTLNRICSEDLCCEIERTERTVR